MLTIRQDYIAIGIFKWKPPFSLFIALFAAHLPCQNNDPE